MKSVFEASTGLEAYMMKNLLATYDVESEVFGEHLQGGVGDLQAIGIVRVMVELIDYDRAKEIVREWESSEVKPIKKDKPATKSSRFLCLFFGCVIGASIVFMALNSPVTSDGIDYDGDGTLEEKWIYNGSILKRTEVDRNDDGEPDEIYYYDLHGLLKSAKFDPDLDGVFEGTTSYKDGKALRSLYDLDKDGFSEYRESYSLGLFISASYYSPETKNIKKIQYYENGLLLIMAEVDTDGDGHLDTQYNYDRFEEIKSTKTIAE